MHKVSHDQLEESKVIPLGVKIELLKKSVEDVQRYELLTTNQYLQQMELVLAILDDIKQSIKTGKTA